MYKYYDVVSEKTEGYHALSATATREAFSLEMKGEKELKNSLQRSWCLNRILKVEFEGFEGYSQAMGLQEQKHKIMKQLGK